MTAADTNVTHYRKESWRLLVPVDTQVERNVASSRIIGVPKVQA